MLTGCLIDKQELTIAYVSLVAIADNAIMLTDEGIRLLILPSLEKATLNSSPLQFKQRDYIIYYTKKLLQPLMITLTMTLHNMPHPQQMRKDFLYRLMK